MCNPEECPLQATSDLYNETSKVLRQENVRVSEEQFERRLVALEQADSWEVLGDAFDGLRDRLNASFDSIDGIAKEADCRFEPALCAGRIIVRQHGTFGKIVSDQCGSLERRERLLGERG